MDHVTSKQGLDNDVLKDMIVTMDMISVIVDSLTKERQQQKPYKELFKAGSTHTALLRELQSKMINPVFDACHIYKERYGMTINEKQYHFLLALPLLVVIAEKDIKKQEGSTYCADKTYYILSENFLALADA